MLMRPRGDTKRSPSIIGKGPGVRSGWTIFNAFETHPNGIPLRQDSAWVGRTQRGISSKSDFCGIVFFSWMRRMSYNVQLVITHIFCVRQFLERKQNLSHELRE